MGRFENVFVQAGGEAIFSLPNEMQGYFLVDASRSVPRGGTDGHRSDPPPQGRAVQNGLSCHGCHMNVGHAVPEGLRRHRQVRGRAPGRLRHEELGRVRKIYPRNGDLILRRTPPGSSGRSRPWAVDREQLSTPAASASGIAWVTLISQYESKIGLRGGATELGVSPTQAANLFQATDARDNEDALPLKISDPLVTREEFEFCKYREVVGQDIRRAANFCNGASTTPGWSPSATRSTESTKTVHRPSTRPPSPWGGRPFEFLKECHDNQVHAESRSGGGRVGSFEQPNEQVNRRRPDWSRSRGGRVAGCPGQLDESTLSADASRPPSVSGPPPGTPLPPPSSPGVGGQGGGAGGRGGMGGRGMGGSSGRRPDAAVNAPRRSPRTAGIPPRSRRSWPSAPAVTAAPRRPRCSTCRARWRRTGC